MGDYLRLVEETLQEWAKKDGSVDIETAKELHNHIDNNQQHYNQKVAVHKRLDQIKKGFNVKKDKATGEKGSYDKEKAVKAFRNVVDNAARTYHKENGGSSSHGTRQAVAQKLHDAYNNRTENDE